ncbi:hypothetical protein OAQ40_06485 [Euryarchaeota archaeon]|nr:hypothetical protein [Euryarchaeota archaeon]
MSWNDREAWHIDHRRPVTSFDLTRGIERIVCFHYTNLHPMWSEQNIKKHASFNTNEFGWEWDGSKWIEKV